MQLSPYTYSMSATSHNDIALLQAFFDRHPRVVVLGGAGISLGSGIPAYRDGDGTWLHSKPIQHQEFLTDATQRQRYWARSIRGWPGVRDAQPSAAHNALAELEAMGLIDTLITQNVDRLHQRAGSKAVIDLHGRLDRVRCLGCDASHNREHIQQQLMANNAWTLQQPSLRPDGDSDLCVEQERDFNVPHCSQCDGTLMPDVVFFGGNVPGKRVQACRDAITKADALLVIGSSLQVFSGFRFCRHAQKLNKPVGILNPGVTRADDMAQLKLRADCQTALPGLFGK